MLGITYHNPATISVFLDRRRFKDCFISQAELREGEWRRKLKQFADVPSDGRERVVFVESFAVLQTMLQQGAEVEGFKVAVYDDCEVLSRVPGASIIDAHVNDDTWQLYTVSFTEFNDALAAQPAGVPDTLTEHQVKEDQDIPAIESARTSPKAEPDEPETPPPSRSKLVMEQILDDIEAEAEDEADEEPEAEHYQPDRLPDAADVARPEPARVMVRKWRPGDPPPPEPEPIEDDDETEPIEPEPPPPPEREPPPKRVPAETKKRKGRPKRKVAEVESYSLFE